MYFSEKIQLGLRAQIYKGLAEFNNWRGRAAAAPCPWAEPGVRLRRCSSWAQHKHLDMARQVPLAATCLHVLCSLSSLCLYLTKPAFLTHLDTVINPSFVHLLNIPNTPNGVTLNKL